MRSGLGALLAAVLVGCAPTPSAIVPTPTTTPVPSIAAAPPSAARPATTGSPAPTIPPRALSSGGAVPDAGVLLFTDATPTLWRYDGATGALQRIVDGFYIRSEGPAGVFITPGVGGTARALEAPTLVSWDGAVHRNWCEARTGLTAVRADGACAYADGDGTFVRSAPGAPATKLLPFSWQVRDIAWSPGGARLALLRELRDTDGQRVFSIWVMDPDGTLRAIYEAKGQYVHAIGWSSDGVYVSARVVFDGQSQETDTVLVVDSLTSELVTIPEETSRGDRWPEWSASGLAYVRGGGVDLWRNKELRVWRQFGSVSLMGGDGRTAAYAPAWDPWRGSLAWVGGPASDAPSASADYLAGRGVGERRAFIAGPGLANRGNPTAIGCPGGPVEGVRWSGDGEQLLMLCRRPGAIDAAFDLWLQPIADGALPRGAPSLLVSGIGSGGASHGLIVPSIFAIAGWSRTTPPPVAGRDPDADLRGGYGFTCGPTDHLGLVTPTAAGCLSRVSGDLDGDGSADSVMLYADRWDVGRKPVGPWKVRIDFGSGRRWDGLFPTTTFFPPGAALAADANGDRRDELFVNLDHGASTSFWGVYEWDGASLRPVERVGAGPLRLAVGGSVTHGAGFECGVGMMTVLGIADRPPDYEAYTWQRQTLIWDGMFAVRDGARASGVIRSTITGLDPSFQRYWGANCDPASLKPVSR